jgi:hypothetical protein
LIEVEVRCHGRSVTHCGVDQLCSCQELLPVLPKHLELAAAVDDESMDCPSSIEQSFNDGGSCQGDSTLDNTPSSNKKRRSAASVRCILLYVITKFICVRCRYELGCVWLNTSMMFCCNYCLCMVRY